MDKLEFRETLAELRTDALNKFGEYLKADEELALEGKFTQNGFIDKRFFDNLEKRRREWEVANNKYSDFARYGGRANLFNNEN